MARPQLGQPFLGGVCVCVQSNLLCFVLGGGLDCYTFCILVGGWVGGWEAGSVSRGSAFLGCSVAIKIFL